MGKRSHVSESDELSLDFSGVKEFFRKTEPEKLIMWAFIAFALILVATIRFMPASLPVAEDWAERTIHDNIRAQFRQQLAQQYPNLPQSNLNARVEEELQKFVAANEPFIEEQKDLLAEQMRSGFRYEANGKEYTYLGDLDSYFWLRYARNYLEKGVVCDEVRDGQCRDNYPLAPIGVETSFNPSLHVFGIAYLHKIITLFDPEYPLPATSFYVSALIGILGVIPAFFIGRRLAGNVGGLFAAILIPLNPLVLSRSIGSDNDAWNITIPLFILWFAVEAVDAKDLKRRVIFGALAGFMVAVHAAAWEGWWFIYLIVLFAFLAYLGFSAARFAVRERRYDLWRSARVQATAVTVGAFYVSALIFLLLFGERTIGEYLTQPLAALSSASGLDQAIGNQYWPNVLTTVAELNKANLHAAIGTLGGAFFFFISMLGLLLMVVPRREMDWRLGTALGASVLVPFILLFLRPDASMTRLAQLMFIALPAITVLAISAFTSWRPGPLIIGVGSTIYLYLIVTPGLSKLTGLALLALPLALAFLYYIFHDVNEQEMHLAASLIVLTWFLATVYATYSGVRFILLMVPAFGIAFGIAAGRVYGWVSAALRKDIPWPHYLTNALVFIILALVLIQPVKAGYGTAKGFLPTIDDAWWDSLTKMREETAPDAIISSWWDFGHWFKYIADRRVSADGTTQGTHVPHWLGKALVTTDEDESVGVLRMLDCGSDAYPSVEGSKGAYGKILKIVNDPIRAEQMVATLVNLDETSARAYLRQQGFTAGQAEDVLASTHCDPPEGYLITSGDMIGKAGVWAHFGLWDFRKAYIVENARNPPENMTPGELVQDFMDRFGYTRGEAQGLYDQARALRSEAEINAFAAPWPGYMTGSWVGCQRPDNRTIACPLGIGIGQNGAASVAIDGFIYNLTEPRQSMLVFGTYQNGRRVGQQNGTPGIIIVADEELSNMTYQDPSANVGVLIDVPNNRVLLADPLLINSVFTQLFYLDGRYNERFEKFDDRTGITGTRVVVWKVDWDER